VSPRHVLALLLAASVSACAAVLGIEEAELIERDAGSPDAVAPPGEAGSACEAYCNCMGQNCSDRFADETACLNACATYTEQQVSCRTYHCGAAAQDPALHCPHALGIGQCP
jgi:hypothetical protein